MKKECNRCLHKIQNELKPHLLRESMSLNNARRIILESAPARALIPLEIVHQIFEIDQATTEMLEQERIREATCIQKKKQTGTKRKYKFGSGTKTRLSKTIRGITGVLTVGISEGVFAIIDFQK